MKYFGIKAYSFWTTTNENGEETRERVDTILAPLVWNCSKCGMLGSEERWYLNQLKDGYCPYCLSELLDITEEEGRNYMNAHEKELCKE